MTETVTYSTDSKTKEVLAFILANRHRGYTASMIIRESIQAMAERIKQESGNPSV